MLEDPQTLIKARVRGDEVCLLIPAFAQSVEMFILGRTGIERREEVGSATSELVLVCNLVRRRQHLQASVVKIIIEVLDLG